MEQEVSSMIVKMYLRGFSNNDILKNLPEEKVEGLDLTPEELSGKIAEVIAEYERFLEERYSCGPDSLVYAKEIESLAELERQAWAKKSATSVIEIKRMKVRLLEFIKDKSAASQQMRLF